MSARMTRISSMLRGSNRFITYDSQTLEGISANAFTTTSTDVEDWLRLSLENTPLSYRKIGLSRFVIIRRPEEKLTLGILTGKITGRSGLPLAGATIWVQALQIGTMTGMNGDYSLTLPQGRHAVAIRYLGYETVVFDPLVIKRGRTLRFDAVLKESNLMLNEIVIARTAPLHGIVSASYAQRNAPYVSSILSGEEINRYACNTVCDALKLISGVAVTEDNGLIVRGAGGRWNEILLDGMVLPNYDPSYKIFSFDLIPLSLVDNIRLLKSSTPDVPVSFGGGVTEITTKDIPEENFVQLKAELQYNSLSTFKNQRRGKMGKLDFFGFDDGSRKMPEEVIPLSGGHFQIYDRNTPLSQLYTVTIGRRYALRQENSLGLIASLSFRNTQQQSLIVHTQRGILTAIENYTGKANERRNAGNAYHYHSVSGGILNLGWQFGKSRISLRNIFTRSFQNDLTEISQHIEVIPGQETHSSLQFFNYPTFSTLLQSKLEGQHAFGDISLRWRASHTFIRRERKDAVFSEAYKPLRDDSLLYYLHKYPELRDMNPISKGWYDNGEQSLGTGISVSFPFNLKDMQNRFSAGYNLDYRSIRYISRMSLLEYQKNLSPPILRTFEQDDFSKIMVRLIPFAMWEHRWNDKFRLMWGVRANYDNIAGKWDWMPSAHLTWMPVSDLNIRMGYQRFVVRPQLADYIPFPVYDTYLLGTSINRPVLPSSVHSFDFQTEKYTGRGDLLSCGLFYRHFLRPIERTTFLYRVDERMYVLQNSDKAFNYGFETNVRKYLDFISHPSFLHNLQLSAGFTLTRSYVEGKRMGMIVNEEGERVFFETESTQKRPLSGQMTGSLNIGINYIDKRVNAGIFFYRNGRQLFVLGEKAYQHEYRAPYHSLNVTVSYHLPKSGILMKLSGTNLLNTSQIFYTNTPDHYLRDRYNVTTDILLPHKTENFDKGYDPVIYHLKSGSTCSLSIIRTF